MSRTLKSIGQLLSIMERLRGPDGCPWDREQTLRSLRPCLLEETYEVLEAIDAGDPRAHCEELGDLLLQIVFQAEIAKEEHKFDLADVAEAISRKLVARHPHVFGDDDAGGLGAIGVASSSARGDGASRAEGGVKDAQGVLRQWASLKHAERKARGGGESVLEGVPREMPALARAERLTEKASRVGFDWPDPAGAREKVSEELSELDDAISAGNSSAVEHEVGDLLFAIVNLARKLGIAPEEALRGSSSRFIARFGHIERELARRGVPHGGASLAEMDAIWDEAKSLERQVKSDAVPGSGASTTVLGKKGG